MIFKQGDIVWVDLSPVQGHEQDGKRPVVVVSNETLNRTGLYMVCPITGTRRAYPTRIPLDDRTETKGSILTDQVRTLDLNARNGQYHESLPEDILDDVVRTVQELVDR